MFLLVFGMIDLLSLDLLFHLKFSFYSPPNSFPCTLCQILKNFLNQSRCQSIWLQFYKIHIRCSLWLLKDSISLLIINVVRSYFYKKTLSSIDLSNDLSTRSTFPFENLKLHLPAVSAMHPLPIEQTVVFRNSDAFPLSKLTFVSS